jgi:NSS family neurotransmitter:Na+ symporter
MSTKNTRRPEGTRPANREGFATSLGVIAATLGSAVGLGNIWKFPSLAGQNGGAAFILIYIICVFLVGLPVMISEFIIGRRSCANAVGSFKKLAPRQPWFLTGIAGVLAAFLIMFFYTDVAGWVYSYIFKSAAGTFAAVRPGDTTNIFNNFVGGLTPIFWQWIVLVVISIVIIAGVTRGIERMTKILLPILFILLLICDVRSLTLPGASAGLAFLFKPDFSKITWTVILTAMGLSFFKLSVGMGTMITYGSYFGKDENMPATGIRVMLADTLVSILAGLAIFPAVFAFGFKPDAGASLLFITIPMVFKAMPLGQLVTVLFFILAAIAATGAMISLLEVPVAYLVEEHRWKRVWATIVSALIMGIIGITATLSTSVLANFKPLLGKTIFDLCDFASSNILLPVGGIFICLFVGWRLGKQVIVEEASNGGLIRNQLLLKVFTIIVQYIAPIAIIIVLLSGLGLIRLG